MPGARTVRAAAGGVGLGLSAGWNLANVGAIVAACNALALAAASPALTVAARAVMGVGTAVCFVAGSDYVRATGGSAFAQGIFGAAGVGSGGLALAIVPQVQKLVEWRAAYVTA